MSARWGWIAVSLLAAVPSLLAKEKPALQPVAMPHVFRDDRGSNWDIQQDSTVGDGGNDLFDGGGRLSINEAQFGSGAPPQLDSSNNELVFAPMQMNGLNVSRRVGCNAKLAYLRYTEILENPTAAPIKTTVRVYFNMGGSVQFSQPIVDEKKTKQAIGQVVGDQNNCMALIGAGRGSKLIPRYTPQPGSDNVDCFWEVDVPAKQTLAITHLIFRRTNQVDGSKVLEEISEKDVVKELSPEVAKKLANFPRGEKFIGDDEVLRGELFDVVELRGGDQYKGTIKQEKYKLVTSYGTVELPADRVIAMMSAGEFRPRQLLVTVDGEIFGGRLEAEAIKLELSNGQTTSVPLSQITRMGYRKRSEEPEEWKFDKPMLVLRGGDRMVVDKPTEPVNVLTRYGNLSLKPETIQAILFVSEDHGVHEIQLTDGSKFAGLVSGNDMRMKMITPGHAEPSAIGISAMRRLQLAIPPEDLDADAPSLVLTNADQLVGSLAGTIKLQTRFDTLTINGAEVRAVSRGNQAAADVQVTLWDSATVSGQLDSETLNVILKSGVEMKVPVALLDLYANPQPRPPTLVVDRIKSIIQDLSSDDWKARDRAETQLATIGPAVVGVLKELRSTQSPEAQQRIDLIMKTVTSGKAAAPENKENQN